MDRALYAHVNTYESLIVNDCISLVDKNTVTHTADKSHPTNRFDVYVIDWGSLSIVLSNLLC